MSTATATAFSAQERAIREGKKTLHENVTPRIVRIFEAIRAYGDPRVEVSRAALFTESFKTTEGQPTVLRWAHALKHIAEKIEVTILPDELIVGRPHTYMGRYALIYPELDGSLFPNGVAAFKALQGKVGHVEVTPDDERVIKEALYPYWNGRDYLTAYVQGLPEPTRCLIWGPDRSNISMQGAAVHETATMRSSQQVIVDFAKILRRGCEGMRAEAQSRLDAIESPDQQSLQGPYLEAVIITCDALTTWGKRYAKLAAEMARSENDSQRKHELEEIAAVCRQVPEKATRTFREAVQMQWFVQMFARLEQNVGGGAMSGRMDQYLWPYYQKDTNEGRLTKQAAEELLQCVWLNMMQSTEAKMSPTAAASTEGFAHFELLGLGGKTRMGLDATNEMSYVILDSVRPLKSSHPDICVRIHSGTPDRFLHAAVESVKDGKGLPKFLNDEVVIPHYLENGASMQDALDYCPSSCADNRVINRETHFTGNGSFNYGAVVEMTLCDGKMKITGDRQIGVRTGDPRSFKTYDDLWQAFKTQLLNLISHCMIQQRVANTLKPRFFAAPLTSMLVETSWQACADVHDHEANLSRFPGAIDLAMIESIGKATAIDSLATMKHLLFDTRSLSWDELLEALEKNWEGHEAIRQKCLNAPKYGNDIEWVDAIGWEIERAIIEFSRQHPRANGRTFVLKCVPVTAHVGYGKVVWATPNGRPAHEYLSEGISASHGMDTKGPTSALKSMSRARVGCYAKDKGPDLINMKFAPGNVAGEEGTRRLMQIIRTWCDLKLWHIQFNILNRETLLAAQKDPEKYRDLVVRIAGYSAYFVDLSPAQQAEIIARTEEAT